MSWSELERLVEDAERDGGLRRCLRHCRSRRELLMATRHLGYGIQMEDIRHAWLLDHPGTQPLNRADQGNLSQGHRATG